MAILAVAAVAWFAVRSRPEVVEPSPVAEPAGPSLDEQAREAFESARREIAAGRMLPALQLTDKALRFRPWDREILALRDQAEAAVETTLEIVGPVYDAEDAYVGERLAAADEILDEDRAHALELLERVLEIDPKHPAAVELRKALTRGPRGPQPATPPPSPTRVATTIPVAAPLPPPTIQRGTLQVLFATEIAEGKLTILAAGRTIDERPFTFEGKRGAFRKKWRAAERGRLDPLRVTLPAGALELEVRVELQLKDRETRTATLRGELPPDGSRNLRLSVNEEGELDAQLE